MFYQFEPIGEENTFQEFCKDLFNCIYGTQSFQLYKTKGSEQHGIDVYSQEYRIALQSKKKKLLRSDKSLESELMQDLDSSLALVKELPFSIDKFYLLTTTKKYGSVQDYAIKLSPQHPFEVVFWSWEDIEPYISQYESLRSRYYRHLSGTKRLPKVLTYIPAIDESEVIGRSKEVKQVGDLLTSSDRILLVNGIGGIGKSTLAKLYVHKNEEHYDHIVWLDVTRRETGSKTESLVEAFTNDFVLANNLGIELNSSMSVENRFFLLLNKLKNISGRNLLIIDNAPAEIRMYEERIPGSPGWKVLLTSRERIEGYHHVDLDTLGNKEAEELFYLHYTVEKSDYVSEILDYIGNHTLTIELLAKTANKKRLPISRLVEKLNEHGLNISEAAKVFVAHDSKRQAVAPFEYLLKIFSIAELADKEQDVLRWFSVLPAKYIHYDDLVILFDIRVEDESFPEMLSQLTFYGWLKEDQGRFFCHQVIQEVLREKLKPSAENCSTLLVSIFEIITIQYHESFFPRLRFLEIAEQVILYLFTGQPEFRALLNNLAVFSDLVGNQQAAMRYNEMAMKLIASDKAESYSASYANLATSYLRAGEYQKALELHLKALRWLEENGKDMNFQIALANNNLAETYRHLGEMDKAIVHNFKSIELLEALSGDSPHAELGTAYNNLSNSYAELENRAASLEYGLKATKIREDVLEKDHPNLAQSYNNLGVDYEKLGDLNKALDYHKKAIEIRERIYKTDHHDLGESYNNLGQIYFLKGDLDSAILYHLKSIKIREKIYPGNHPDKITAYGNLGNIYVIKKDFSSAGKYFDLAVAVAENHLNPTGRIFAVAFFNYAFFKYVIGDVAKAKIYLDKSLATFDKIFDRSHESYKMALEFKERLENRNKSERRFDKIGRNDPCPCGSGKKYKNCCGKSL